jgi:hypothetical protein
MPAFGQMLAHHDTGPAEAYSPADLGSRWRPSVTE